MHHRADASRDTGFVGDRAADPVDSPDELILYAVPEGSFAASCTKYWERTHAAGRETVAQTFPPHCTLTGFFWRHRTRVDAVLEDLERAVPERMVAADGVTGNLEAIDNWVGFTLSAPRLDELIKRFVIEHSAAAGEDALRAKSGLHLSLAYGAGTDVEWHHRLAREVFDGAPFPPWSIGLWRRVGGRWERLDDR